MERVSPVAYRIRIPHSYDIHPVISIAHLEKYQKGDPNEDHPKLKPLRSDPQEYEVIRIVAQKWGTKHGRKIQLYQCKWTGHGITDEWIPVSYFRNAPAILQAWNDRRRDSPETTARTLLLLANATFKQ